MNVMNESGNTGCIIQLGPSNSTINCEYVVGPVILLSFFFPFTLNVLVLMALLTDSKTDKIVCLLFGNIVLASLTVCVLLAASHIITLALPFSPDSSVSLCKATVVLSHAAGSGRMLLTLTYAVLVLLVIRYWNKPVLSPRNVKYFIMVVIGLWCAATVGALPLVFDDVSVICVVGRPRQRHILWRSVYTGLHSLLFFIAPMIVTVASVIAANCYAKRYNILKESATVKAIVRFAFFIILDQVLTAVSHLGIQSALGADNSTMQLAFHSVADLSLIASPIFIIAFFRPTRKKLKFWLSCCIKGVNFNGQA